jgi:hypothetical protein
MACLPATYWEDRLAIVMALIVAYDAAILALSTGAVQSYSLDTGQTRQTVTKQNITSLRDTRQSLLNELATLEARVCGAGVHLVPNF